MKYEAYIIRTGDWYLADVPKIPGCMSRGHTEEEAIANIREAIINHLKVSKADLMNAPRTQSITIEITQDSLPASGSDAEEIKDPILQLSGLGKEIWEGIEPDNYVRGEREAWD